MATKTIGKADVSNESIAQDVKLLHGKKNNFMRWKISQTIICTKLFGKQANVMKNNVAYVVPAVVENDYVPIIEEGGEQMNEVNIALLRLDAEKNRNKAIARLKEAATIFFVTLWDAASVESQEVIRQHDDYEAADLEQDPNLLWMIIVETHLTNVNGGGDEMRVFDRIQLEREFAAFSQRNLSIGAFKAAFSEHCNTLVGAGARESTEAELAVQFLSKLDMSRYGSMMTDLANQAMRGIAFPQTVADAYTTAANWRVAKMISNSSEIQSVFAFADEAQKSPNKGDHGTKQKENNGSSGLNNGRGRGSSGRSGGSRIWGDRGGNGRGRGIGGGMGNRGGAHGNTGGRGDAVRSGAGETGGVEYRTCRVCLKKGHIAKDCPDNEARVMVAIGEEDEEDENEVYESNFVVTPECDCCEQSDRVLFAGTEVLLDNQASQSIFQNESMLHAVCDIIPYRLGGIDGTVKSGLKVSKAGSFRDLSGVAGKVGFSSGAAANVLSKTKLIDAGYVITYDNVLDEYRLTGDEQFYVFSRKLSQHGKKCGHYSCDMADHSPGVYVTTVADNMRRYTKREVSDAKAARELMARLGNASSKATIDMLERGVMNCSVTKEDVRRADAIFGSSVASLKGKTNKLSSSAAAVTIAPRVTQVQQILAVDIFFIKRLPFLLGVMSPLGLSQCTALKDRGVACVATALRVFFSTAASRGFDCVQLRTDGEGAVGAMAGELNSIGVIVEVAGPGQHVPVVERMIQTVKKRVRTLEHSLPFVMTRLLIIMCVLFCVSRINMQASSASTDRTSPLEQFTGRKLDAKIDLRIQFGDYLQATVPATDNSMATRTQGCIAMLPTGNLTGSVKMWCLNTNAVITRDQFTILPMPDVVSNYITARAEKEGYSRSEDPVMDSSLFDQDNDDVEADLAPLLPDMIAIDNRDDGIVPQARDTSVVLDAGVGVTGVANEVTVAETGAANIEATEITTIEQSPKVDIPPSVETTANYASRSFGSRWSRRQRGIAADKDFVFAMSVRAAMRDRGEAARPVIMSELQQMVDKNVWHAVKTSTLSSSERRGIIRSSMFLKDKYSASGEFDRFKARLVAGGDGQDKELYDNLSSPTAATASVFSIAAIAASEGRIVEVVDIGGAFLNADMAPTGVLVRMRLDRVMTSMLLMIDASYAPFVEENGSMVVQLDKALYGCVEAAALWYDDLRAKLLADGFEANPYDVCVFNKTCSDGSQITIVLHVDDLMVTCIHQDNLDAFGSYLRSVYAETRTIRGTTIDYIGMTFYFSVRGEVSLTMQNCINDILSGCGVTTGRATPAASVLFDVRSATKLGVAESKWFHTYVAKMLYLSKRVRPECLTAVAFLSTRVLICDIDDMAKLKRLLGYLYATRDRGIVLRIGDNLEVRAYIDAAYGVHQESGKSHTGCAIVLGEGGPVYAKSSKQKIVTKSSTEAELVGLSDTASQAIHLRNFVVAQGYDVGPVVIYQDNMSCMALMKRGSPGSERSRHINIRHFWLSEKVGDKQVAIEHLGTEEMFANVLTKPVQGAQFLKERLGLTNWGRS